MTHPLPFRKQVLATMEKKRLTIPQAAELFAVGIASIVRWRKRLEPQVTRNKPTTKINMKKLVRDVEKYPDAYLRERAKRLKASITGVAHALDRLRISRKKNHVSSKGRRRSKVCPPGKNRGA